MISSRDSKQKERTHLWGFSDDDFGNFEKAKKVLQKELNQGKWKNVKITLFFTGVNVKDVPPHALVLRANQEARKFEDFEDQEWKAQLISK